MDENTKILIMAGGTGGHVFPALSIANFLVSKGITVEWLGTKAGLEAKVIGDTDIPIHYISVSGLRGKSLLKKLFSPIVIVVAIVQSLIKVAAIKPGCVLGMGGFVTGPGGVAAWLLGKHLCIHEQNAIAGLTNQLLFPLAGTVMEAFPGAFERKQSITKNSILQRFIKENRAIVVGNPVRQDISNCLAPEHRFTKKTNKLRMLVVGGSLGAIAINQLIPELLTRFSEDERPEVIHQCGEKNFLETQKLYSDYNLDLDEKIKVQPFINDMAEAYSWADLVVCRSGALTVSEIAKVGLASVLIPYPSAVDDHQTENAKILNNVGAADILQQEGLSVEKVENIIRKYDANRHLILKSAQAAWNVGQFDATGKVAKVCLDVCHA